MEEILVKVRAEIERLYNQSLADEDRQADRGLERAASVSYGKSKACKELLSFIDSMQKEPVSEIDFEQELYKYFGQVKDFTLGMRIAKRFYKIGKNHQEPVSEDLEKASKEWLKPQLDKSYANYGEAKMMELTHFDGYSMLDAIEFGANWQFEQLMAKAVDVSIAIPYPNGNGGYSQIFDSKETLPFGDNIKVLVIKEG